MRPLEDKVQVKMQETQATKVAIAPLVFTYAAGQHGFAGQPQEKEELLARN